MARGSAAAVFNVIDRVPSIDSLSTEGRRLDSVNGEIEFRNIAFRYPARKDVKVLQALNLKINRGETVALVGESGCGKSTCIQLIQRLYDPLDGQVSSLLIRLIKRILFSCHNIERNVIFDINNHYFQEGY